MSAPHVTIIIVTWNARALLATCLPSVVATRYSDFEIVVADNGSTDGSAEWVEQTHPGVRVIRHPENWGFCRGNNEAIRQTSSPFVVLLNNDVEVDPDWLTRLVSRAGSDPGIAAVQPKLLQYERRDHFEYAGASGGFLDRLGYPFARGRVFFELERDEGQYDGAADVFWASGAALLLRRSALDEVGLLDESFEFHMEEIDLCWRLRSAGYRVMAEPASVAYHIGGSSLPSDNPRKTYYNFRNSLVMLYKNLAPPEWRRIFVQRALMDAVAAIRFAALLKPAHALAVLRAYRDAHRMKSTVARPALSIPPPYTGSIVVDYFVRRRRTFAALPRDRFAQQPPAESESE